MAALFFKFVTDPPEVPLNFVQNNHNDKQRLDFVLKGFQDKLKVHPVLSVEGIIKREVDENCMMLYVFLIFKASLKPPQNSNKALQSQSSSDCDKNYKQAFKKWGKKEIDFQKVVEIHEMALKSVGDDNVENHPQELVFHLRQQSFQVPMRRKPKRCFEFLSESFGSVKRRN